MPTTNLMPDVRVQLERAGFYPGQRVAGVVTVTVTRPLRLRGLRMRLVGVEQVLVHYGRQARWVTTPIIDQELVLVGRDRLPDAGAIIVDTWDAALQRARHTTLMPGEYIYPFAIPLPSLAPPSYVGKISRVDYRLEMTLDRPMRTVRMQSVPLKVLPPGREATASPLSLSTSGEQQTSNGLETPSGGASLSICLDSQEFTAGTTVSGEYTAESLNGGPLEGLVISLRSKEETNARGGSGSEQWDVVRLRVPFTDASAPVQKGTFSLEILETLPPSISARTFVLSYELWVRLVAPKSSDLTLCADVGITSAPVKR